MQTRIVSRSSFLRHHWLVRAAGALLAIGAIAAMPAPVHARVYVSVNIAPPALPFYAQPMIPGPGYIWTPGYWSWGGDGYYWVPGRWVLPPFLGALWTPGYWGWNDGVYVFHRGYWGRHVGFYGGVDYGYGYTGRGYEGGYWRGDRFYYNRSVNHVGGNVRNVYSRNVIHHDRNRTSYSGGPRGTSARAMAQGRGAQHDEYRSAGFAPHGDRSMRSTQPGRYRSQDRGAGMAAQDHGPMRESRYTGRPEVRAQDGRSPRYLSQGQGSASRAYENRGGDRAAGGRGYAAHSNESRGRGAPASERGRRGNDDRHHQDGGH